MGARVGQLPEQLAQIPVRLAPVGFGGLDQALQDRARLGSARASKKTARSLLPHPERPDREIKECFWMPVDDFLTSEDVHDFNRRIVRDALVNPGLQYSSIVPDAEVFMADGAG